MIADVDIKIAGLQDQDCRIARSSTCDLPKG